MKALTRRAAHRVDGGCGDGGAHNPSNPQNDESLRQEIAKLRGLVEQHLEERISLQAMIDAVPDYLWVKDVNSAFLVANKAVADDNRRDDGRGIIGLDDFDLHPRERAQKFFDAE